MIISQDKTECLLFTTSTKEAKYEPELNLMDQKVKYNPQPVFLGIKFDWCLSFTTHAKEVASKMRKRNNILKSLAGRDWGSSPESLRSIYITYIRTKGEYASGAWQQCLSMSAKEKIEIAQNEAARIITGCVANTPIDSLLRESALMPIKERGKMMTAIGKEKYLCLPDEIPINQLTQLHKPYRLKTKRNWRNETQSDEKLT